MGEKIAVIVPVYNVEKYIDECVNSIQRQTYKNIEIILVDDGSNDCSLELCRQLSAGDSRIKVLHKENGGSLSARQYGLEHATAPYIMFVDSDDWVAPDICHVLYTTMISEKVDMVASGIIRWISEDKLIYDYNSVPEGKYMGDDYRNYILAHMLCDGVFPCRGIDASLDIKIFRKDILYPIVKKANVEYGHLFMEDTAVLYPYMLKISSLYVLHQCFYYHRQYENHDSVYYDDPDFMDKLKKIHGYLTEEFRQYDNAELLIRQLDYCVTGYFYMKNVRKLKPMLRYLPDMHQFLFPFDIVPKGAHVLLYGAGKVGQSYFAQLQKLNYCKQIIWVDKNWKNYQELRFPVRGIYAKVDVDYCVIAIQDERVSQEITDELVALGMDLQKIIWKSPLLNMW